MAKDKRFEMKKISLIQTIFLIFVSLSGYSQSSVKLGAYYFDGWTGTYPYHITEALRDSFQEREPKWGWITSKQKIIDEQILLAADAGISFFSFCWYFDGQTNYKNQVLNNALNYYVNSPNKSKLKYCIMVANHQGNEIAPGDWDFVSTEWIKYFKQENYLQSNKKPLLIFFTLSTLIKNFGSEEAVKLAFDELKKRAVDQGLNGVSIALCTGSNKETIRKAELCGFDLLTGYNYHEAGFGKTQKVPIDSLIAGETKVWNKIPNLSNLKYIPVVTINWDPRPWSNSSNRYDKAPYYVGFSPSSVYKSLQNCLRWLTQNTAVLTEEKLAIIYAWNENGEGAYLTPSKNGVNVLQGVKKAIKP